MAGSARELRPSVDTLMGQAAILKSQRDDFPGWYQDVVAKAELAENGAVRGTMVIRPYGYALWERMQSELDARIKRAGAENVYLPLLIPYSYIQKEAEHVKGFRPELATVTHAGGKQLEEALAIRPTSETLFGEVMARWVQSHRDLPLLLNQWANVVRWELRPRLFLRTTEFLWQEGHTAHATAAGASAYALRILTDVYQDFMERVLALPVLVGRKTRRERFAGAVNTLTCEALMRDGKALQMATSHELGQNFSRAFGINFSDSDGSQQFAWTTSWGSSTRMIGGLIMAHGDEHGLRVPPIIAPIQVAIVVVHDEPAVLQVGDQLARHLVDQGIRARVDRDLTRTLGRRIIDWELKGVPIRVELGSRDVAAHRCVLVRRDTQSKESVAESQAVALIGGALSAIQQNLYEDRLQALRAGITETSSIATATEAAQRGFARLPYALITEESEAALAQRGVTVRCIQDPDGQVPASEDQRGLTAVVGRAY